LKRALNIGPKFNNQQLTDFDTYDQAAKYITDTRQRRNELPDLITTARDNYRTAVTEDARLNSTARQMELGIKNMQNR